MRTRFYLTHIPHNGHFGFYLCSFDKKIAAHYPLDYLNPRWLRTLCTATYFDKNNNRRNKHPIFLKVIYVGFFNSQRFNKPVHEILRRIRRKMWVRCNPKLIEDIEYQFNYRDK